MIIGGDAGPVWCQDSGEGLSAIAIIPTSCGFVVAADGRGTPSDSDSAVLDDTQKIFTARFKGVGCAWAFTGITHDDETGFDLVGESTRAVNDLAEMKDVPVDECVEALSNRLHCYVKEAIENGSFTIESLNQTNHKNVIARIYLVGYFLRRDPSLAEIILSCDGQGLSAASTTITRSPGRRLAGSYKIAERYSQGDAGFGKYFSSPGPSLEEGLSHAIGYIRACMDPAALNIDPICCKAIGGRIHAAFVTPNDGFRWAQGYEPVFTRVIDRA